MPPNTIFTKVRRLMGMVNNAERFIPHLSDVAAPLRLLLNKTNALIWGPSQEGAFQRLKLFLSSETCMDKYNPKYPTTVSADASSYELGAALL